MSTVPPFDWGAWLTWLGGHAKAGIVLFGELWTVHVVPLVGWVPAPVVGVGVVVLVGLWLLTRR